MSKILVVDDDGFTRSLLADTVRALGHSVTVAADAREGLQHLVNAPHDGVITDVRMPGWDGIELARRVALLPDAPTVILMSSDPDFDVHEEALRRGVRPTSFLQKPFDRVAVSRAVNVLTQGDVTAPTGTSKPDLVNVPRGRDDLPEWLQHVRGTVRELPPCARLVRRLAQASERRAHRAARAEGPDAPWVQAGTGRRDPGGAVAAREPAPTGRDRGDALRRRGWGDGRRGVAGRSAPGGRWRRRAVDARRSRGRRTL